jgi:hypothetical protein
MTWAAVTRVLREPTWPSMKYFVFDWIRVSKGDESEVDN